VDLGEQDGGVGAAVVPPLVQVSGVRVDDAVAVGVGQQLAHVSGVGEAAYGLRVQAEPPTDLGAGDVLDQQLLDLAIAFPGAGDEPDFFDR
jgi:hypothetical protein